MISSGRYTLWAPDPGNPLFGFLDRRRVYGVPATPCNGPNEAEDTMWKRDEAVKPTGGGQQAPAGPATQNQQTSAPAAPQPDSRRQQQIERDVVNIGKSVVIKGELNGSEDLTIEGHVEGKIELKDHVLTIGPNGKIKAAVFAKAVIVL